MQDEQPINKTIQSMKREIEALTKALNQRAIECDQLRTYKTFYENTRDESEQLQSETRAQFEISQRLRQENEYLEVQVLALRREAQVASENASDWQAEVEELKALLPMIRSLQQQQQQQLILGNHIENCYIVKALESQVQQLNRDLQTAKKKPNDQLRLRTRELESLVVAKEEEVNDLYTALQQLKQFAEFEKGRANEFEDTLQRAKGEYIKLQNALQREKDQKQRLAEQINELLEVIQNLKDERMHQLKEIEQLRRIMNETKNTHQEQQIKIDKLLSNNDMIQHQNQEILAKIDEQFKEAKILRDLLEQKDHQMDNLIQENALIQQESRGRMDTIDVLKREELVLIAKIAVYETQQRITDNNIDEERAVRLQAQRQVELLSQEAERKENALQLQEETNGEHQERLIFLENQLSKNETELILTRRQLANKNQLSSAHERLQQSLIVKEREILHLQSLIERLESRPDEGRERESSLHKVEGLSIRDYLEKRRIERPSTSITRQSQQTQLPLKKIPQKK